MRARTLMRILYLCARRRFVNSLNRVWCVRDARNPYFYGYIAPSGGLKDPMNPPAMRFICDMRERFVARGQKYNYIVYSDYVQCIIVANGYYR